MSGQELGPGNDARMPEITEDNLHEAGPRVRAWIVAEYQRMYGQVERHMAEADAGDRSLDPRMLEIGKGIMKEVTAIYRLGKPAPTVEEDDDDPAAGVDRRTVVEAKLVEIEARLQAKKPAD